MALRVIRGMLRIYGLVCGYLPLDIRHLIDALGMEPRMQDVSIGRVNRVDDAFHVRTAGGARNPQDRAAYQ